MTEWGDKAVETVARAIRRRQFERTRRLAAFDESAPPTENELDNAHAAIIAYHGWLATPTNAMLEASNREWDGRMSYRSSGAFQSVLDAAKREIEGK